MAVITIQTIFKIVFGFTLALCCMSNDADCKEPPSLPSSTVEANLNETPAEVTNESQFSNDLAVYEMMQKDIFAKKHEWDSKHNVADISTFSQSYVSLKAWLKISVQAAFEQRKKLLKSMAKKVFLQEIEQLLEVIRVNPLPWLPKKELSKLLGVNDNAEYAAQRLKLEETNLVKRAFRQLKNVRDAIVRMSIEYFGLSKKQIENEMAKCQAETATNIIQLVRECLPSLKLSNQPNDHLLLTVAAAMCLYDMLANKNVSTDGLPYSLIQYADQSTIGFGAELQVEKLLREEFKQYNINAGTASEDEKWWVQEFLVGGGLNEYGIKYCC